MDNLQGPKRSSKALPKAQLAPKKGHGHCLVVCCLSDPLQLSESQWNHYIWEVSSVSQWDAPKMPAAGIGQQNGPNPSPPLLNHSLHNQCFKSWTDWATKVLPHPPYSPDLSPTDYHFMHLDDFFQGKCFYKEEAENAHFEFTESQGMDFYATGIKLFLIGKNVLIIMVPILINKDVFEPS